MDTILDKVSNAIDTSVNVLTTGAQGAFSVLPIVAGIIFLVAGLFELVRELRGNKVRAEAVVVGMDWKSDPFHHSPPTACPRLRVDLNGQERELFNGAHSSSSRRFKEGMKVRIRINPDNPDDYYIDELLTPARFSLLVGAGLILFGLASRTNFFG